jgi:hypothetical protein
MPKFQVVSGFHVDEEGRKYGKGEVVESPHDLTATFRGKFTKVEPTIADFRPPPGPPIAYTDRPLTAPQTALVAPQPGGPAVASQPAETDEAGAPGEAIGQDVTARFPKAVEQDYKVFKRGPKFFVYDADEPAKAINPDGARRDEVDAIIDKDLKPE